MSGLFFTIKTFRIPWINPFLSKLFSEKLKPIRCTELVAFRVSFRQRWLHVVFASGELIIKKEKKLVKVQHSSQKIYSNLRGNA